MMLRGAQSKSHATRFNENFMHLMVVHTTTCASLWRAKLDGVQTDSSLTSWQSRSLRTLSPSAS
jgi:hypothetical protein